MVKIVRTHDQKRYERAKREINFLKMFHKVKNIGNIVHGASQKARRGVPAKCACILEYFELGTVQTLLDTADPRFTESHVDTGGVTCLLFKETVAMAKDVLDGLECMHQMSIVHRDIKPANICVEMLPSATHLRFKIIDLGCAVSKVTRSSTSSRSSSAAPPPLQHGFTGQFTDLAGLKLPLGTLLFMSPEQLDRSTTVDGRSDVFCLGVTLYKCMSGRFPFVQPNRHWDEDKLARELIIKFGSSAEASPLVTPAHGTDARVRNVMATLVAKAIRKAPVERFSNASAMKAHVQRIDRYHPTPNRVSKTLNPKPNPKPKV